MASSQYKAEAEIGGRTIVYYVSKRPISGPKMKIGNGRLTVYAPVSMSGASVEQFVADNIDWISSRSDKLAGGQPGSRPRSDEEFKELAAGLLSKYFHSLPPDCGIAAGMPGLRFRQMINQAVTCDREKNIVTVNRALRNSPKEAVSIAVAAGLAQTASKDGMAETGILFEKICPEWRAYKQKLPPDLRRKLPTFIN